MPAGLPRVPVPLPELRGRSRRAGGPGTPTWPARKTAPTSIARSLAQRGWWSTRIGSVMSEGADSQPVALGASRVELRVSCWSLPDREANIKPDPCLIIQLLSDGQWSEVGRSEVLHGSRNPVFAHVFALDYFFEEMQNLKFQVFDADGESDADLGCESGMLIGIIECSLGQIVSQTKVTKELGLPNGETLENSTITIEAEEVSRTNEFVQLEFCGQELDDKDFFSKSDPFLEIYKVGIGELENLVWRTEVVKNNLSPRWQPFRISLQSLCSCDPDKPIRCVVYDHDSSGKHDYIGEFSTSFQEMLQAASGEEVKWDCINHKYQEKKKNYKNSGYVVLTQCKVAIDFTASNGDPRSEHSLHFINPREPNEYLKTLSSVGEICQDYDSDKRFKRFPAFGFGARIPPDFEVTHDFAINFDPDNPECEKILGVIEAYKRCLPQIELYGPTNVAPIINKVAGPAAEEEKSGMPTKYRVLLILTDGVVSDMPEACDAVVRASRLPLSIIIVGIGNADFSDMRELNGDRGMLETEEGRAVRDIVQFVPVREFKKSGHNALAKTVLAEVPRQVVEYYGSKGIPPGTQKSSSPLPQ
ncbi:copine-6 isoform X2 [Erythrolamprus reginae]|uniref:copine-6 isoform X2 n=1 Tax=Erythrolamprus reginae TaxID=121349 RepID=UPI00396CB1E0